MRPSRWSAVRHSFTALNVGLWSVPDAILIRPTPAKTRSRTNDPAPPSFHAADMVTRRSDVTSDGCCAAAGHLIQRWRALAPTSCAGSDHRMRSSTGAGGASVPIGAPTAAVRCGPYRGCRRSRACTKLGYQSRRSRCGPGAAHGGQHSPPLIRVPHHHCLLRWTRPRSSAPVRPPALYESGRQDDRSGQAPVGERLNRCCTGDRGRIPRNASACSQYPVTVL